MTSTAVLRLCTGDSALILPRRLAMNLACLMKPCVSTEEQTLDEVACGDEILRFLLEELMNNRLMSSNWNCCRHSGHLEIPSSADGLPINSSMQAEQYVCPADDDKRCDQWIIFFEIYHKEESVYLEI
jgi:hypothetical protein